MFHIRHTAKRPAAPAAVPPEPPYGLYTCASVRCPYLYVHDADGWFYIWDAETSPGKPLLWSKSSRLTWAVLQEWQGDCTAQPLRRIMP